MLIFNFSDRSRGLLMTLTYSGNTGFKIMLFKGYIGLSWLQKKLALCQESQAMLIYNARALGYCQS